MLWGTLRLLFHIDMEWLFQQLLQTFGAFSAELFQHKAFLLSIHKVQFVDWNNCIVCNLLQQMNQMSVYAFDACFIIG
ncbi:hypothetical protein D3C76_513980 [compost metagenome]